MLGLMVPTFKKCAYLLLSISSEGGESEVVEH